MFWAGKHVGIFASSKLIQELNIWDQMFRVKANRPTSKTGTSIIVATFSLRCLALMQEKFAG
jgi:hypothetical protein